MKNISAQQISVIYLFAIKVSNVRYSGGTMDVFNWYLLYTESIPILTRTK